jgi:regulator of sigma E protease
LSVQKSFQITQKAYSLLGAIPAGINKTYQTIKSYLTDLKLIFSPKTEAYKSVGSVIAIANIFPSFWDWKIFWNITALLSIMFSVLNILPIPALDGGHILFVFYEMITGRKPGEKFLEYAQMVGMIILLAIMVLAFGNDIFRFIIK